MVKVLVINLCQMGDLVQASPFFHDLKSRNAHLTLLVRRDQEEVARHLPGVDRIVTLDLAALKGQLREMNHQRILEAYGYVYQQLQVLFDEPFDSLYNMTHTRIGALLSEAFPASEKWGILVPDGTNRYISGDTIRYLQQILSHRELNNIHVVDLHRALLGSPLEKKGLFFERTPEEERKADQILEREGIHPSDLLIGIQAGANEERKRWPASQYGELARTILKNRNARVLLFGVESEIPWNREIQGTAGRHIIDLAGKTDVGALASILHRCRILISNDTGTSHLAAAVGTSVISLHPGHVTFRETGPYGEGHIAIQVRMDCSPCSPLTPCDHFHCHHVLSPEAVHHVVRYILDGVGIPQDGSLQNLEIMASEFDEWNFLTHRPLLERPRNMTDHLRDLFGTYWKNTLTGAALQDVQEVQTGGRRDMRDHDGLSASFLAPLSQLNQKLLEAEKSSGQLAREAARTKNQQKISQLANLFKSQHTEILAMGHQVPFLRPVTEFYDIEQQNILAKTLPEVMRAYEWILANTRNQLKNLEQMLSPQSTRPLFGL